MLIDEIASQIEALYERISFTPAFRELVQDWVVAQIDSFASESKAELDRLRKQQEKLEREQRKVLQAHYADAIPLHLLKEEQERIGKALKNITNQIGAYRTEYDEISSNLNDVFTLLDNCGLAYKLAGDFERRCFNQALFDKIYAHEDTDVVAEYAEPFATLLDPNIFVLKSEFEKHTSDIQDGRPQTAAHLSLTALLKKCKTKTSSIFHSAGLSMNLQLPKTGLEPARSPART